MKIKWLPWLALLAALLIGGWLVGLQAAPISGTVTLGEGYRVRTGQYGWSYARDRGSTGDGWIDVDDTTPEPNAMTWQNTGDYFPLSGEWNTNSLEFIAYGDGTGDGDPNAGTFDCNVYVAEPFSSWEKVASFSCAVGELELTHNPVTGTVFTAGGALDPNESYKGVEGEFSSLLQYWTTDVDTAGTTNSMGRLTFDPLGGRVLIVQIDNKANITKIMPIVKGR